MPTLLKIENYPDLNTKDNAQLSAEADAADTTVFIDGAPNIDIDDFIYIGRVGQASLDPVEKRQVTAVAPGQATVAALTYGHPNYSPVKAVYGDQLQLYRAADVDGSAPADASFSTLGSPVDLDAGQADTEYIDDTGSNLFWYKWRYRNSDSSTYVTDLSQVDAVRGEEYGNYTTLAAIRKEAGMQANPYISDALVREVRREAESVINSAIGNKYTVPLDTPIPGIIERATKLLAAGYLLKRDYGLGEVGTSSKGQDKIDEVLGTKDKPGILSGILDGSTTLVDSGGSDLTSSATGIKGWPLSTTKDAEVADGGSPRKFRMGQQF